MTSQNIKAVILAGGLGTRISEETYLKPKPMIEIGNRPIIWHIMKIYSSYGINEFIVCCGYKGYLIREYFYNYLMYTSDMTIDLKLNKVNYSSKHSNNWKITFVDTGQETMTGGRIKRILKYVKNEDFFHLTYGDGLSDVNISNLQEFHKSSSKLATLTAVNPPGRYGALTLENNLVKKFKEKPDEGGLINGGFFVISPKCIDLIEDDQTSWEKEPLEKLAKDNQLNAFKHSGFWQPMDTLREKQILESLWSTGKAPWKTWS